MESESEVSNQVQADTAINSVMASKTQKIPHIHDGIVGVAYFIGLIILALIIGYVLF